MREHNQEKMKFLVSFSASFLAPEVMRDAKNSENVLCWSRLCLIMTFLYHSLHGLDHTISLWQRVPVLVTVKVLILFKRCKVHLTLSSCLNCLWDYMGSGIGNVIWYWRENVRPRVFIDACHWWYYHTHIKWIWRRMFYLLNLRNLPSFWENKVGRDFGVHHVRN